MNKRSIQFSFITLLLFCFVPLAYYQYSSSQKVPNKQAFRKWYSTFNAGKRFKSQPAIVYTYIYNSPEMKIDKIYRSMEGPYCIGTINLASTTQKIKQFFTGPELYWLVGYSVEVVDAKNENVISDEWMCHNNLNTASKTKVPWTGETIGSNIRLFTLTEGQTKLKLPEGFGIPILSNQKIEIVSQVLNHNIQNPNLFINQRITLEYIKDSELNKPMIPLYQQSAFVTKLINGATGEYDEPIDGTKKLINENDSILSNHPCCSIEKRAANDYNPYKDSCNREFTGHWTFQPGIEILKTNVTRMLNLKYNTIAHYISVHVHPFCESLELFDKTENKSLFKANVINSKNRIGLTHIDTFESIEGITLFKDHQYEIISTYNNITQRSHTAMATMFLYLEDKN